MTIAVDLGREATKQTKPTIEMIRSHKNVLERFVTQLYCVHEEEITTVDATDSTYLNTKGVTLSTYMYHQAVMLCISTSLE